MTNSENKLDFGMLWPEFDRLYQAFGGKQAVDTQTLSAIVVAIIFTLFAIFSIWVLYGATQTRRRINFYFALLDGINEEDLPRERSNLVKRAAANMSLGRLWLEFDKSLVTSPDKERIWNTVDGDYLFNTSTLASGITDSRLISAVPGFLTALGVIGTFAGLQFSLREIGFDASTPPGELSDKIHKIINGASLAFLTSLWGIGASVVFNLFEKSIEQALRKKIDQLQAKIVFLFPKIIPEQQLVAIEDHERESRIILQGLAERIGDRMQVAFNNLSEKLAESIASSLGMVLGPAVENLVAASSDLSNRQITSSEEALKSLVEGFTERINRQADIQRELMSVASSEMKNSATQFANGLENFVDNVEEKFDVMRNSQSEFVKHVSSTIENHVIQTQQILRQGDLLAEKVEAMSKRLTDIVQGLESSASSLRDGAELLNGTTSRIDETLGQFSKVLEASTESTRQYVNEASGFLNFVNESVSFLAEFENRSKDTVDTVGEIARTVHSGLSQLERSQDAFLQGMKENLESIQSHVAELLTDYGEKVTGQTTDRLNVWNQQTREYSQQMVNAVGSMHEILSEIEDILEVIRRD